jgi:terminase large subunit-like protein
MRRARSPVRAIVVRAIYFDPFQMQSVSQRLTAAGLPMIEAAHTVPFLTEMSTSLYELVKGANLHVYRDDALRKSIHAAVAIETARGWKLAKRKTSDKIDAVVALAMAALGAVKAGQSVGEGYVAAVNLSREPTIAVLNANPEDEAAGCARERILREREEFRREALYDTLGALDDGPLGYGTRRSWRDGF